jgi:hypothetical protein
VTMAGPDILGIPAPAGVLTALSVAATTITAASIILAVGLGILMIAMRIFGKRLEFLSGFQRTINRTFLPTLTVFVAGIFLSLLMEYLTLGHSLFFAESNLSESSDVFYILSYLARIVFLAGVALAAGCIFITLANHMRDGNERITIFTLRIVCGAVFAASCARIADISITASNHPANPAMSGIIIVGAFTAAATIGSAILGILRPRQSLWSAATAIILFIGLAASSYIDVSFAEEAYRAAAPTFGAAYRTQPALMAIFFVFTACAATVIGLMLNWWMRGVKSEV